MKELKTTGPRFLQPGLLLSGSLLAEPNRNWVRKSVDPSQGEKGVGVETHMDRETVTDVRETPLPRVGGTQ